MKTTFGFGAALAAILACSPSAHAVGMAGFMPLDRGVLAPHPVSLRHAVAADQAALSLKVSRGDAQVILDGRPVGQARAFAHSRTALCLAPGTHRLELERSGYRPLVTTLAVEGGRSYEMHFQLHRQS